MGVVRGEKLVKHRCLVAQYDECFVSIQGGLDVVDHIHHTR